MSLIPSSLITNTNAGASPDVLKDLQDLSSTSLSSIGSASTSVSKLTTSIGSATAAVGSVGTLADQFQKDVISKSAAYLQSSLSSINGAFDKNVTSLASGLDSKLSSIFKETTLVNAANPTTQISDPINTNLTSKKLPNSTPFKVGPSEAASQIVKMSGSISSLGSKAQQMIGTQLSTVLNRLSISNPNNILSSITNSRASKEIAGLFSSAGSLVKSTQKLTGSVSSVLPTGVSNDIASYMAQAKSVTTLTGTDAASYYMQNANYSLVDTRTGDPVYTGNSNIDAASANGILQIAKLVGCDTNGLIEYGSASQLGSLFNLILGLASKNGMKSLVQSLLGCNYGSSYMGQLSTINAFNSSAVSDPGMGRMLVDYVDNKSALANDALLKDIVTNKSLSSSSIGDVDYIMESLGTTTKDAFTLGRTNPDYSGVYDLQTVSKASPSFVNTAFSDKTLTTFLSGVPLSLKADGSFQI